jgi:hypothetical protein
VEPLKEYLPAEQSETTNRPVVAQNLPAAHEVQALWPVSELYWPAGQTAQLLVAILGWYKPPAQLEHALADAAEYWPLGQVE